MLRNHKLKTTLLGILIFLVATCEIFSQTLNDFRTTGSGPNDNWTTLANWEIYDDVSDTWVAPTYYPGDGATNDVSIIEDHTITLNTNLPNTINSVTIGDRNGIATDISTLEVDGDYSINSLQFTIAYDGLLFWTGNHTFSLPNGAAFSVERDNPYPSNEIGVDYGIFENTSGCNVNKKIEIGSTVYSNCNGGGPNPKPLEFEEVNDAGGNLSVSPSANTPVCSGSLVSLIANPAGTELSASATYEWIATSSPVAYSFSSTLENPTDTPTAIGTYVYEVTITDSGISSFSSVTVEINDCNKTIVTNRRITYRVNGGSAVATFGPIGTEVTINVPDYQDNFTFQLKIGFANTTIADNWEIFIEGVDYDALPATFFSNSIFGGGPSTNIQPADYVITTNDNGDGTYDHLITATTNIVLGNNEIQFGGNKSTGSAGICPLGSCVSFHIID